MSGRRAYIVFGMAAPRPEEGKPLPRTVEGVLFAHVVESGSVRADNFAREIARDLEDGSADGILQGWPPESDFIHLWHIAIAMRPTHAKRAEATFDYAALCPCPLRQRQLMVRFVDALRRLGMKCDRNLVWPELPAEKEQQ